MACIKTFISVIIFAFILSTNALSQTSHKLRVLVLTDIEADPDDSQSMIRFLTYSNQWDIEGLIATTSIHQKTRVAPETVREILNAYKKVQPNLLKHEKGYPTFEYLSAKVKKGLPVYGMEGVGKNHDSEGSEWIIKTLEQHDARPVWICAWGGTNCLAQALWKIQQTKPAAEAQALYKKIRVYTISDQDDSGPWIRKTFPGLFYVCSPGYTYGQATWLGMSFSFPGSNTQVISNDWLAKNIQQGHGPLGAAYPDVAYGMEGDSPSFLGLIQNGLNDPEHPNYGGWGGRYEFYTPPLSKAPDPFARPNWPVTEQETRPLWANAEDSVYVDIDRKGYKSIQATIWRWRQEFQNDFAARMTWTTRNYAATNHPPVPMLAHADHFTVKSGQLFHLNAKGTHDPDGDSLSYLWFQYPEAGTYKGLVSFKPYSSNLYDLPVTAPVVTSAQTIHFILKVTDKGTPALTRYKRVIVTVLPG
ncbi:DUF1593 domain-containing protein [Mucilaginibacter sabulilitoris]|uniref:DUF1593 domain-containing protein n=1 Tax=Mucilaginibacter sabulilitoris TaxID=1173583 RepID=A0ABZ0TLB7_9SPHI|nr:nucleoside hydrolase-like domain-containing protein [Mucilaginibacter sabulilitoris]WPU92330.1 DUF1593 domain-containing protein [Mucilaginibacter sabulilitoris]